LLESGFNPHTSSHGLSGAELTRLPLNAPTSNQKSNCNVKPAKALGLNVPATLLAQADEVIE
jgi:hypothetical protein